MKKCTLGIFPLKNNLADLTNFFPGFLLLALSDFIASSTSLFCAALASKKSKPDICFWNSFCFCWYSWRGRSLKDCGLTTLGRRASSLLCSSVFSWKLTLRFIGDADLLFDLGVGDLDLVCLYLRRRRPCASVRGDAYGSLFTSFILPRRLPPLRLLSFGLTRRWRLRP